MKNILCGAVAAIALVAAAAPASAQTNQLHYAGIDAPIVGDYTITNPQNFPFPFNFIGIGAGELGVAAQYGTRYRAVADAPADSETATPTVNVVFTLSGSVNKDCSFYSGNTNAARNIDFGVIGVRTGDNENVNNAFEMVGPAFANIDTLTAGCNFNNEVEITKSSAAGLVNTTVSGFDSNQFQNNIPYSVNATWVGTGNQVSGSPGSPQSLSLSTTGLTATEQQGAWRSRMDIDFLAPAVTSKGLVAGDYSGTTTLTLRAL